MKITYRISAVIAYIPIFGWLYGFLVQRKNPFIMFHLRQSVLVFLNLLVVFLGWGLIAYLITFIPYAFVIGMMLFTLVICAFFYCLFAYFIGIINALKGREVLLPIFGRYLFHPSPNISR